MYGRRFNRLTDYLLCVCLFAVFGFSVDAQAQITPATAEQLGKWWANIPNGSQAVTPGTAGSFGVSVVPQPSAIQGGGFSIKPVDNGWPDAGVRSTPRGVPGAPVVDVVAKLKPLGVAAAVGRFATKVITPISIGFAVFDLAKELGFNMSNSSGSVTFSQTPNFDGFVYSPGVGEFYDPMAACQWSAAQHPTSGGPYFLWTAVSVAFPNCKFSLVLQNGSTTEYDKVVDLDTLSRRAVSAGPPPVPATRQQFEDAIAAKSGWPSSSAIGRAIADVANSGESLPVDTPVLSGPASTQGVKEVITKSDGSIVTNQTSNNYTYQGDKVTYDQRVTTTNFNPVTNTTTTDVKVTTNNASTPAETPDPCAKNPDSVGCANLDTVAEGVIPRETKQVTFGVEAISWGASASCPAPLNYTAPVTGQSVVLSYTPFCDIASRMRPFILAGAAFVAMLIVMTGIRA